MPPKRTGYSSYITRPRFKATRRITMPGVPKRPIRFQIRSILRHELIRGGMPWWMVVHRRGLHRDTVGDNPLEARAVPHSMVAGYLDERILYAALVNLCHFVPNVDFLYQSSVDGGRIEMGGLVSDFLFPTLRVVINPLGPQHYQFRNMAKDEEQVALLAEMGYTCYLIDQSVIYDELQLEEFLRRVFGGMPSGGGSPGAFPSLIESSDEQDANNYDDLYHTIKDLEVTLYGQFS